MSAGGPWFNQGFPELTSSFRVDFDATPSTGSVDAVVGVSNGSAAGFAALAANIRFSADGVIDARSGSGYQAANPFPYQAGKTYHLQLSIDMGARTYDAYVVNDNGQAVFLASGYAFRTEQQTTQSLSNVASKVDADTGSLALCRVTVRPNDPTGCLSFGHGEGFFSVPLADATVLDTVHFTMQASDPDVDTVIGLSAGPATKYADIAVAVRFAPNGTIDMRDRGTYRADVTQSYGNAVVKLEMITDVSSHTYSVFRATGSFNPDTIELGKQFGFRTEQLGATHLDHLSGITDGDHGLVTVCGVHTLPSVNVAYSREANPVVVPFADNSALVAYGGVTYRVDASGHPVNSTTRTGATLGFADMTSAIADISGTVLTLDRYEANLLTRWHVTQTVPSGAVIRAMGAAVDNGVLVALGNPAAGNVLVWRFGPSGALVSQTSLANDGKVVFDSEQLIVIREDAGNTALHVTRFALDGSVMWNRDFAGIATIGALIVDPSHDLVFGGELGSAMDFGGGPLRLIQTEDGGQNAFVVKLSVAGDHVFSQRTGYTTVSGIGSNGPRIVVSGTFRTQFRYPQLQIFDASGKPAPARFGADFGENGSGGTVAVGLTGRIWWNFDAQLAHFTAFPYMIAGGE